LAGSFHRVREIKLSRDERLVILLVDCCAPRFQDGAVLKFPRRMLRTLPFFSNFSAYPEHTTRSRPCTNHLPNNSMSLGAEIAWMRSTRSPVVRLPIDENH
jgi:hypothetical protein